MIGTGSGGCLNASDLVRTFSEMAFRRDSFIGALVKGVVGTEFTSRGVGEGVRLYCTGELSHDISESDADGGVSVSVSELVD